MSALSTIKNNKYLHLLIGGVLLLFIQLFNGTHGVYLFDTGIVYNYGYLLHLHMQPFRDFTSPMLPLPGMLQNICYALFGLNYMSGVYGAAIVLIFHYITLYLLFARVLRSNYKAWGYAFTIGLCCMPVMGVLFYNYMIMAFITIYYAASIYLYFTANDYKNHYSTALLQYLMVALIILTKLQFGAYLIVSALFFDCCYLFVIKQQTFGKALKEMAIRFVFFIIIVAGVLLISHSHIKDYFAYAKSISLLHNLSRFQILGFFGFPANPGVVIAPTLLFITYLLYYFNTTKKHTKTSLFYALFVSSIYLMSFIVIMFSQESYAIVLIPLVIVIMMLFEAEYSKHNSKESLHFFAKAFKPALLFMIIIYFSLYALISIRKSYNESAGDYPIYLSIKNKFSFNNSTPELQHFFNHVKVLESQYHDYTALDSALKANPAQKTFFGPELEMFNIVYNVKPLIQWPVWIHPNLTVTGSHYPKMEHDFKTVNYDLIVLSKQRHVVLPFVPFLPAYLKDNYTQVNSGSDWILIYKRNKPATAQADTTARRSYISHHKQRRHTSTGMPSLFDFFFTALY